MTLEVQIKDLESDNELLVRIQSGCHRSFAKLVERHTDKFYRLAASVLGSSSEADDVMQMVFLRLWQQPFSWNPADAKFTTWFYRVVLNQCRDRIRSINSAQTALSKYSAPTQQTSAEDLLEQRQVIDHSRSQLLHAISRLSTAQRDAINLKVFGELSQKQVAEVMGLSVKAVESLLVRAKKKLAAIMQAEGLIEPESHMLHDNVAVEQSRFTV